MILKCSVGVRGGAGGGPEAEGMEMTLVPEEPPIQVGSMVGTGPRSRIWCDLSGFMACNVEWRFYAVFNRCGWYTVYRGAKGCGYRL